MAKILEIQNSLKELKELIDKSKFPILEASIARKMFDPITDFECLIFFDKLFFEYLKEEDVLDTYKLLLETKRYDSLLKFFEQNYRIIGNPKTNTEVLKSLVDNNKNLVNFSNVIYANIEHLQGVVFETGGEKEYVSTCLCVPENLVDNKLIIYIFENSDNIVDYNSLLISKSDYILEKKGLSEIQKILELLSIGMEKTQDLKSKNIISKCHDKINERKIEEVKESIKIKLRQ